MIIPADPAGPMRETVYLLLGANLGDREYTIRAAIDQIAERIGPVLLKSSIYETAPWGVVNQPSFLNSVVAVSTFLSAEKVLEDILLIERALGRIRQERWGVRLIDIDILYYGARVHESPTLTIPHPRMAERRFTLEPLNEIAPDFIHPVLHQRNAALLALCTDDSDVSLFCAS